MPTDASGIYSLPNGYLAIAGVTIQPSQHNPPLEDIALALSARLPRNGAAPMTGPFKAADGSAAAPSIAFNTQQNTGFYKSASGIGVAVGGVSVVEFTPAGLASGARFLGELIPYTGSVALPLTVFPVGQTLLRAAYPALWTFAQSEIAAGNVFYNNGDGVSTFGIGDVRGRVFAGKDNMGGSAAGRLTTSLGGVDGATIGAPGGLSTHTLNGGELPVVTPSGNVIGTFSGSGTGTASNGQATNGNGPGPSVVPTWLNGAANGSANLGVNVTVAGSIAATFAGNSFGSGFAHNNTQPTIITNVLLFAGA